MQRAYSLLNIKSIDEDARIVEGIATTPTADRLGDIVEPAGAEFTLPLPLLWQHDAHQPIGEVFEAKVSAKGIAIKARVFKAEEPGTLKDRLDEAWQSLKLRLVRGLSIGFSSIEAAIIKDTWAMHFLKWSWLELSAVTIPANAEATILTVKSADAALLAAIGERQRAERTEAAAERPGATGKAVIVKSTVPKGRNTMKTIAEQIASFEAKRAANAARMAAIMESAADNDRSLDANETTEYDGLKDEVKSIDDHLVRLREHEKLIAEKAKPVAKETDPVKATESRVPAMSGVRVQPNVEKGIAFTRYVKALAVARGDVINALHYAERMKHWVEQTPQVIEHLKASVVAGDSLTSGWASELVYNQDLAAEFIELLRPMTIIGKLTAVTRVPFNVRMSGQDSGSTAYWVGQGKPVPVSKLNTLEVTLGIAKAAGLVVLTEELVRSSAPSAEMLVRNDLMKSVAQFLDVHFIAPDYAAVTNVSPASITNGVTPTAATGTGSADLRKDLQTLFNILDAANVDTTQCALITTPKIARAIGLMLNALGQPVFPGMSVEGGTLLGTPVIVSNSAMQVGSPVSGEGNLLVLVNQPDILLADDGGVSVDASREASLEMLDNPTNDTTTPTATSMVSMFQTNSVAIRATRFINWKKRRSTAVAYIKDAAYVS